MPSKMTLTEIVDAAAQLSYEDLILLNKHVVSMARRKHQLKANAIAGKFQFNQIVSFAPKKRFGSIAYIRIEKFNRAGTAVVGYECTKEGVKLPGAVRWTVGVTLCSAVK